MPRRSLRLACLFCLAVTPGIAAEIAPPPALPPRSPAIAARAASLIVPDLRSPVARRSFTDHAQAICGRNYAITDHALNAGVPPGTVLSQTPLPGSRVGCRDPVTVQISLGPATAPAVTPAPTPIVPGLAALDPRTRLVAIVAALAIALLIAWRLLAHRPPTKHTAPPAEYDIVRDGAGTVTAIVVVQPIGRAVPDIAIDLRIVAASCTAADPLPITHLEYHDERTADAWRAA